MSSGPNIGLNFFSQHVATVTKMFELLVMMFELLVMLLEKNPRVVKSAVMNNGIVINALNHFLKEMSTQLSVHEFFALKDSMRF